MQTKNSLNSKRQFKSEQKGIIPTLKQRPLQSGIKMSFPLIRSSLTLPLVCTDFWWLNSSGEDLTLFFRSRFLQHGQRWLQSSDGDHRGERWMAGWWFSQVTMHLFFYSFENSISVDHRHWWIGFEWLNFTTFSASNFKIRSHCGVKYIICVCGMHETWRNWTFDALKCLYW